MDAGGGTDQELNEIRRRARRRWLWTMAVVGVAGGVAGPIGARFFDRRHPGTQHGHTSALAAVVGIAVALAVLAAIMWWFWRRSKRSDGVFTPPLTGGLPRTRRRAVGRAIRNGVPSANATDREIERRTAERLVRQARTSGVVFGALVTLSAVEASVGDRSTAGRVFYSVTTVMFAAMFAWTWWFTRRARRYLAASDGVATRSTGGDP